MSPKKADRGELSWANASPPRVRVIASDRSRGTALQSSLPLILLSETRRSTLCGQEGRLYYEHGCGNDHVRTLRSGAAGVEGVPPVGHFLRRNCGPLCEVATSLSGQPVEWCSRRRALAGSIFVRSPPGGGAVLELPRLKRAFRSSLATAAPVAHFSTLSHSPTMHHGRNSASCTLDQRDTISGAE